MTPFRHTTAAGRGWRAVPVAGVVLLTSAIAACTPKVQPPVTTPAAGAIVLAETVRVRVAGAVRELPLEDYVLGAVLAEVAPVGEAPDAVTRILETQAIVARTYGVTQVGRHRTEGFDLCDTTHCQVYDPARVKTSRFSAAAADAVRRTAGQVVAYGPHTAEALFHADCGGVTAPADAVWGGRPVPYLRAVDDDVPTAAHRSWRVIATRTQLRDALNADPRTAVGGQLESIEVMARDASGRAASLSVRGERSYTVRGDVLRAVINRKLGDRAMLSTRFSVTRDKAGWVFDGTGFGHGVGLCQRGAAARARRGDAVADILQAYFPGARLTPPRATQ